MGETEIGNRADSSEPGLVNGAFIIDNTSLAMFKECPKKYELAILRGFRPRTAAAPLTFGKAYHDALETYDRDLAKGADTDTALRAAIRVGLRAWEPSEDSRRSRDSLVRAIVWYVEQYKHDIMKTVVLPNGRAAVELSFRVEVPFSFSHSDDPVLYCGHIDRVAEYNGQLYAVEHKHTVSGLYDSYWDRYTFSSQISGYVMALKAQFNLNVAGALIDATQVGATFARYGRRIAHRVEAHQQEWITDLSYWMSQLDLCIRSDRFPHNTESCSKYSGCQFREVCFSSPHVRESILNAHFKVEKWNPLKPRGEEV